MTAQFDQTKTAVLSMDLQAGIVSIYTKDDKENFLARVSRVLDWARINKYQVIHVRVGFRLGLPEVSSHNPFFASIKNSPQHQQLFQGSIGEIHPHISPLPNEVVIIKHRINAFFGTDLDMILRANGIDTLILMGIATSGVVLSTTLDASDNDYRIFVVSDCCADLDPELHSMLLEKFLPQRATVLKAADLIGELP